jgi:hypothetical protein
LELLHPIHEAAFVGTFYIQYVHEMRQYRFWLELFTSNIQDLLVGTFYIQNVHETVPVFVVTFYIHVLTGPFVLTGEIRQYWMEPFTSNPKVPSNETILDGTFYVNGLEKTVEVEKTLLPRRIRFMHCNREGVNVK